MSSNSNPEDCLFCKIAGGKLPCDKVYEDPNYLVFLDIRPRAPGHSLVVPKKHQRWVWDVADLSGYFGLAKKIVAAQRQAFGTEMIFGHIMGDEVAHAHIWLVPERAEKGGDWSREEIVRQIKKYL